MTVAANLLDAADKAARNIEAKWIANTLAANVAGFVNDLASVFVDGTTNDHPLLNWLGVLIGVQPTIVTYSGADQTAVGAIMPKELVTQYVYRLFKFANVYRNTLALMTAGQATSLLAAYNTRFG